MVSVGKKFVRLGFVFCLFTAFYSLYQPKTLVDQYRQLRRSKRFDVANSTVIRGWSGQMQPHNLTFSFSNATILPDAIDVTIAQLGKSWIQDDDPDKKKWYQLSASSVWLPKEQVYMTVSRVLFSEYADWDYPKISHIAGQLFDVNWNQLEKTISCNGHALSFPRIFDVGEGGKYRDGIWLGPEDPRIVLQDHPDAEPIIVFNMVGDMFNSGNKRTLWVFRPFTNVMTPLQIVGQKPKDQEKNWTPFFSSNDLGSISFIYSFIRLQVLKCSLLDGYCNVVHVEESADETAMRGGSNFIKLDSQQTFGPEIWIGFPRTHVSGCGFKCRKPGYYRPRLAVMIVHANRMEFVHVTEDIDFGIPAAIEGLIAQHQATTPRRLISPAQIEKKQFAQPVCIVTPNSLTRTDFDKDIFELTLSVQDTVNVVISIHGLAAQIRKIPSVQKRLAEVARDGALVTPVRSEQARPMFKSVDTAKEVCHSLRPATWEADLLKEEEEKRMKEEAAERDRAEAEADAQKVQEVLDVEEAARQSASSLTERELTKATDVAHAPAMDSVDSFGEIPKFQVDSDKTPRKPMSTVLTPGASADDPEHRGPPK